MAYKQVVTHCQQSSVYKRHLKCAQSVNEWGVILDLMGCPCLPQPLFVIYAAAALLHKILISAAARQLMALTMFWA